jgi:predicted transcriptional regulator
MSPADDKPEFDSVTEEDWFERLSLEERAEHIAAVEEGIAAADRGETVPLEEVLAWMRTWGTPIPLPAPRSKPR